MDKEYLWVEKYRPKKIAECILTEDLKSQFEAFVSTNKLPNLILSGTSGLGKTTIAKAVLEELGYDYIVINASMEGNIDTLRTKIKDFATTVSFTGNRKCVILDEFDYANAQSTQPAMRNFMEEYSNNCGFIMTCNYRDRIIQPLHSRCTHIDFTVPKKELPKLAMRFLQRLEQILENEGIQYEKKALAALISNHAPDWRKVLMEAQGLSVSGSITVESLRNTGQGLINQMISAMKSKDYSGLRKLVAQSGDLDSMVFFRTMYDNASQHVKKSSIPTLVLILGTYMYRDAVVADREINIMACMTEIMLECEFDE